MTETLNIPIAVRGVVEEKSLAQLQNCVRDSAIAAALMGDHHFGYNMPVGGVVAYREHISVSGVGYDIGCGNQAVRTDIQAADIMQAGGIVRLMDEIVRRVSFGMGRNNDEPVDHPVLEEIAHARFYPQRKMLQTARNQLGTVGAGNHYVDILMDEDGWLWIGVHFGSRGFGHKTATGFMAMAKGGQFGDKAPDSEFTAPPILLSTESDIGQSYLQAMALAGRYAYAGRDVVIGTILDILGANTTYKVHNHHNYAWWEKVGDTHAWVVRKGATPAWPGQQGFVGATMAEPSVILEGIESPGSEALLHSTVHGAGRVMSRTAAAGRSRKRWTCSNRDCDWVQQPRTHKPEDGQCPKCGNGRLRKHWVHEGEGKIDWAKVKSNLGALGIELRGAAADEAPEAYKRLPEVLAAHADTIRIQHRLTPLGVAMAGPDIEDPFKD